MSNLQPAPWRAVFFNDAELSLRVEDRPMVLIPEDKHTTTAAIYKHYEDQARATPPRGYLGPSVLGHECDRALWYGFRWAAASEDFSGRKLRLFETGHREEKRVIENLRAIGMDVTGEQAVMVALGGHFRAHMDGIINSGVIEAPKSPHVLEVKTHNEKSYASLFKSGVKKSKPGHYAQMQLYMLHAKIERALYVAVNKNDDSIYTERVRFDKTYAENLMIRARRIIEASTAPTKLHSDPDAREAYICGWCAFKGICHENVFAYRNCRTCLHATPLIDGGDSDNSGTWHCGRFNKSLTRKEQEAGCHRHLYLPSLVPGEQTDATTDVDDADMPTVATVTYVLKIDGEEWIDGFPTQGLST
jgi:CRISPR/Cas system-associated exonuclease Cas4 (RecB family)